MAQLGVADLKAPAAHGTDQVVVRPVGHDGHEVQAHRLLRPDVMEEHLVMAVRAYARRDLALILRAACPEAEDHHHAAGVPCQEPAAPSAAVICSMASASAGLTLCPCSRWAAATLLARVRTKCW